MNKESELESNDQKLIDIRLTAEKHWEYTKKVIEKSLLISMNKEDVKKLLKICHIIYTEPFIHGYKHRLEEEGLIK